MTQASFDTLAAELKYLWKVKRPEVTAKVSEAAAQGDRSENAEYIYGKKQLREIDGRIRYLSKRLDNAEVVTRLPDDRDRVFFGAWVQLISSDGSEQRLRLVGTDEAATQPGHISIDSPMARALLGKRIDDEIEVTGPGGTDAYEILGIEYQN
jgi:transcription elongation factor GreB